MKYLTTGFVVENLNIACGIFKAVITVPEIAHSCSPGQFVNIYFPGSARIFPRPFSIAGVDGDQICLIYKVIGTQTMEMSHWKPDESIKILGPLGNSFPLPKSDEKVILLAGGVGAAPLMFLRDEMVKKGIKPDFLLGAQTKSELPFQSDKMSNLVIATDDGSMGIQGFVTKTLFKALAKRGEATTIYACGPDSMMKALKNKVISDKVTVYVSLEKTMACGLGLCQGCIVTNTAGKSHKPYSLVCKDGPVFNINDVGFND